jgi:hypothetical protein
MTVSCSCRLVWTQRWRITEIRLLGYVAPAPGDRKNRASKYCRSSTASDCSRSPSTVSSQVDRNRVS